MKYSISRNTTAFLLALLLGLCSCQDDWLEVKRNRQMIVPATLKDFSLLLTDEVNMASDYISLMQISADDYYLATVRYTALGTRIEQNAYLWKEEIYEQQASIADWDNSYNQVLTANVILDGLAKIPADEKNQLEWNRVKGGALYVRAKAFYNLAQTFARPYDPSTSASDPGIPLRVESDINPRTTRSSVEDTYSRIVADLKEAARLLPARRDFKTDPSRAGACGLLARCYLSMSDYVMAEAYADSSLQEYSVLVNYNALNATALFPFKRFNDETVVFGQTSPLYSVFVFLYANYVDESLYQMYDDNDLRKSLFFHQLGTGHTFKGTYDGGVTPFSGIATDEMYLVRAECRARAGNIQGSMDDLNTLLVNRFTSGTFVARSAASPEEALDLILLERRKELVGRGLRWTDLRRLNKDPRYATTLTRSIDGIDYTLEPNDPRYVFAIPQYVINKTGIAQNAR